MDFRVVDNGLWTRTKSLNPNNKPLRQILLRSYFILEEPEGSTEKLSGFAIGHKAIETCLVIIL